MQSSGKYSGVAGPGVGPQPLPYLSGWDCKEGLNLARPELPDQTGRCRCGSSAKEGHPKAPWSQSKGAGEQGKARKLGESIKGRPGAQWLGIYLGLRA